MMITLCGSAQFRHDFVRAERALSLRGHSVFSPTFEAGMLQDDREKALLDLVHLAKIEDSDGIVIVGDGYIGESVAKEILWATFRGRDVLPLWPFTNFALRPGGDRINWHDVNMALHTGVDWGTMLQRRCERVLLEGGSDIKEH